MNFFTKTSIAFLTMVSLIFLSGCVTNMQKDAERNDITKASVMITNMSETSGGTGIIIRSRSTSSLILTNSHVCRVVENGGLVTATEGKFMVTGYKHSQKYDLCLIKVDANLKYNNKISKREPTPFYEETAVSGHPALYPNVITKGHISGRRNVAVMVGIKACDKEDMKDPDKALFCIFAGGLPIIKEYDSVLVTATIMPGSSGSGVYNKDLELTGVVFAGSGQIGYGWTVPYEAMRNFLFEEQKEFPFVSPDNTIRLSNEKERNANFEEKIKELCDSPEKSEAVTKICNDFNSNLIWYK